MCTNPRFLRVVSSVYRSESFMNCPCGKCLDCVNKRQNNIVTRLILESENNHKHVYFVTLTFRDDTIPFKTFECIDSKENSICIETGEFDSVICSYNYSVADSSIWTAFRKRFESRCRRKYDNWNENSFKYYCTSEYGPHTQRFHLHLVVFTDLSLSDFRELFLSRWRVEFGFYRVREISNFRDPSSEGYRKLCYVAKYSSKGVFESDLVKRGLAPRCFHSSSPRLGWNKAYDIRYSINSLVDSLKGELIKVECTFDPYFSKVFSVDYIKKIENYLSVYVGKFRYSIAPSLRKIILKGWSDIAQARAIWLQNQFVERIEIQFGDQIEIQNLHNKEIAEYRFFLDRDQHIYNKLLSTYQKSFC